MEPESVPPASYWGTQPQVGTSAFLPSLDARVAARILVAALGTGLFGQLLLVGQSIGINVLLLSVALLGAARAVRREGPTLDRADRWLPAATLAFGGVLAIRGAPSLVAFDLLATLALAGASVAAILGHAVTRRAVSAITLLGLLLVLGAGIAAAALAPGFAPVRSRLRTNRSSAAWPVVRGLVIALPIVLVFGASFAAADAVFQRVLTDAITINVDLGDALARLLVVACVAWAVGGLLATAVDPLPLGSAVAPPDAALGAQRRERLGAVEATTVIIAVDLVFAVFVLLQATYLFGGRDTIALTGLSYSEYARRGFMELLGASFLAGLLVLGCEALIGRRSRAFTASAIGLTIMAGIVLVSAAVRLGLYQGAYGWTELRFYALAAIVWVGTCLAAAGWLLARGRARWLPHVAAILGFTVALVVNIADPQAFVATQNVDRARHPERIEAGGRSGLDAEYLGTLGVDAIPTLVDALPTLPPAEAELLRRALRDRQQELGARAAEQGWPSLNLARQRALEALGSLPPDS